MARRTRGVVSMSRSRNLTREEIIMKAMLAVAAALIVLVASSVADASGWKTVTSPRPEVVTTVQRAGEEALVVKCWKDPWWFAAVKRSAVGIKVWKYGMTVDDFCWNGRRIVLIHTRRWTRINVPFWDFCCHISQQITWNPCCGTPAWSYRRFTEGKFQWLGAPGPATYTPELTFYARGDGFSAHKSEVN
jgi:hypothetical protein